MVDLGVGGEGFANVFQTDAAEDCKVGHVEFDFGVFDHDAFPAEEEDSLRHGLDALDVGCGRRTGLCAANERPVCVLQQFWRYLCKYDRDRHQAWVGLVL